MNTISMYKFIGRILACLLLFTGLQSAAQTNGKGIKSKTPKNESNIEIRDMLSELQGRWASLQDKKSFFLVKEHKKINFYQERVVDTTFLNFYDKCPANISEKDGLKIAGKYLIFYNKNYRFKCYRIIRLTVNNLVLQQKWNRKILRFKKEYYR